MSVEKGKKTDYLDSNGYHYSDVNMEQTIFCYIIHSYPEGLSIDKIFVGDIFLV